MREHRLRSVFVVALGWLCLSAAVVQAQWTPLNPVSKVQQDTDGATFTMGKGTLKIQVCSDAIVHVLYSPTASFPKKTDFVVIKESWPAAKFRSCTS